MPDVTIPDKPAFKASEVCELAQIQPYVLRSWESEFSDLGLSKTPGGPRVYRRIDVERVLRIRELVFTEGLTLSGVRRRFEAEQPPAEEDLFALVAEVEAAQAAEARARVESAAPRAVRKTARLSRSISLLRLPNRSASRRLYHHLSWPHLHRSRLPCRQRPTPTRAVEVGHARAAHHAGRQPGAASTTSPARQGLTPWPQSGGASGRVLQFAFAPFGAGRDVAQPGSAPEWGSGGREFESRHPDQ